MTQPQPPEPVGALEVAGRLGVRRETVAQWKQRGLLPPARWTVSGQDAWDWNLDIRPWAEQTRRWPAGEDTTENGEFEIIDAEQSQIAPELATLRTRLEAFADGLERHHARGGRSAVAVAKLNMARMIREMLEES